MGIISFLSSSISILLYYVVFLRPLLEAPELLSNILKLTDIPACNIKLIHQSGSSSSREGFLTGLSLKRIALLSNFTGTSGTGPFLFFVTFRT